MKFIFLVTLFLVGKIAHAETLREANNRKDMLSRIDVMLKTSKEAREALKIEKVDAACDKVEELFKLYPEHLTDIGQHMNLFKKKENKLKDTVFAQLIQVHQETNTCRSGKDFENVDPKLLSKNLKKIEGSLKRQHDFIEDRDTSANNAFYYRYEF